MKHVYVFALFCLLLGCGKAEDGQDGSNGSDGKPVPGDQGPSGTPGSDSVINKRFCKLSWPLAGEPAGRSYEAVYNAVFYKEGVKLASLSVTYKTAAGSALDESKSLLVANAQDQKATIEMGLWTGGLSADLASFDLFRKATKETRSVKCL